MAIISPWGPLTRNGLLVRATPNKLFDFSHAPFADQFTVNGQNILTGPITLQVQGSTGGDVLQTVTAVPTVSSENDEQITLAWTWNGLNNIGASGTITVNYDGVVQYDFALKRTVSKRFKKVTLSIPVIPEIARYLLRWPRVGTDDLNVQNYGDAGGYETWSYTWANSVNWPKQLCLHNTKFGLEWLTDSDRNCGMTGYAGSTATITANATTGVLTINLINDNFPGNGTTDLNYTMWLTPLPIKNIPSDHNLPRLGDCGTTPANTQFRPLTEECPDMHFKYVGSLTKRDGSYGTPSQTFDQKRTARLARGLGAPGYVSINNWAEADPDYNPAWYLRPGFSGYTVNCAGGSPYGFVTIDCRGTGFEDVVTQRVTNALAYCEGIYYDTAQPPYLPAALDDAGVNRHAYPIAMNRHLYRKLQLLVQDESQHTFVHAGQDILAAVHGCCDYSVGGEEYRNDIEGLGNTTGRRRWYHEYLAPHYWRGEQAVMSAMGLKQVLIPQLATGDYNTSNERIATEVFLSSCASHNLGVWQSFSLAAVVSEYFDALIEFGLDSAARFVGYWELDEALAVNNETDEDSQLSHFLAGNKLLLVCANIQDTDRAIPVHLLARATSNRILYRSTGTSVNEGRTTPYVGVVTGSEQDYTVGVSRHGLTLVEFTLDLANTYTVGEGSIYVPGARDGALGVTARPSSAWRPGAVEGWIKSY